MLSAMRASLLRRFAILVMLAGLPVAVGAARQPQAAEKGVALVTVDFRVLTRDGTPVLDVGANDVKLKVGGRQRAIVALELVRVPTAAQTVPKPAVAASPFVTNAAATEGGREVLLVVDDEGIGAGREKRVRTTLETLIAALSPADRVGWLLTKDASTRVAPTTDRKIIEQTIAHFGGRAPRAETDADAACRSRRNLDALLGAFELVMPSTPTIVVFLSNGFTTPPAVEPVDRGARAQRAATGPCEIQTRDFEALTRAASTSHAHVFGIQVIDDTIAAAASSADMNAGFEHIAGLSGNGVIRLIGDRSPEVQRIATETAAYYVAAFEVPVAERNGSMQRVEVTVARPNVRVRSWPSVAMRKADAGKASAWKLRDVLSLTRLFSELSIRDDIYTSRAFPDGKQKVVCVIEPSDPGVQLAEAGIALFDVNGTARAQWTAQAADLKQMPMIAQMSVPPGSYRVRIAATDSSGTVGTLDQQLAIEAAPPTIPALGPLILGTLGRDGFRPRLQFTDEPVANGAVEIYGTPKAANVAAVFELAASESGPALAVLPGKVQAVREDVRVAVMTFPIKDMPPGDVVVRALVSVDGNALAVTPTRTLRKVAR